MLRKDVHARARDGDWRDEDECHKDHSRASFVFSNSSIMFNAWRKAWAKDKGDDALPADQSSTTLVGDESILSPPEANEALVLGTKIPLDEAENRSETQSSSLIATESSELPDSSSALIPGDILLPGSPTTGEDESASIEPPSKRRRLDIAHPEVQDQTAGLPLPSTALSSHIDECFNAAVLSNRTNHPQVLPPFT